MQGCQAVLIGQVRADPALEELADCGEDRGGQGSGAEVGCRPVSPAQAPAQGTWVTCCAVARTAEEHREGRRDPRAQAEGSGLGPQAGHFLQIVCIYNTTSVVSDYRLGQFCLA